MILTFDKKSPSKVDEDISIKAICEENDNLEYKFFQGAQGERNLVWKQIRDFSGENECIWKPKEPGEYMLMVQAVDNSSGSTETIRATYEIKGIEEKDSIE